MLENSKFYKECETLAPLSPRHPRIYQVLMANNGLVVQAKRLKTGGFEKLNKFLYLLKSICN